MPSYGIAVDADSVLGWAAGALRRRWGPAIDVEPGGVLAGSGRSGVLRVSVSGANAAVETAVVKVYGEGARSWQNEAAAAAYFGRVAPGLTPDLLAVDGSHRLVVLTDLGDHRQLSDVLLDSDAGAAERALLEWGGSLGDLLGRTFGGRAELERVRSQLGLGSAAPPWDGRMHAACTALAEAARSRLGVSAPAGLDRDLAAALGLLAEVTWEVVTPADMCPDNNLLTPSGVRFLDLEFAGCSPVFFEAAYARLPFPSCWCAFDIPSELAQRMEGALRGSLVRGRPELADDATWSSGMARGCLLWTVLRVGGLLVRSPDEWRLGVWDRDGTAVPEGDRVTIHYLARAGQTLGAELPAAAELLSTIHERLAARFDDLDIPPYPALREWRSDPAGCRVGDR